MGWTGLHRETGLTDRAFFEREFPSTEILACATVKGVFYAACRSKDKPDTVWALIVEIKRTRDYWNFTYKDIDEGMGPYSIDCPAAILDLLTPTDSKWANEWREKCRARLAAKAARPKVRKGDRIKFATPITFTNGEERDTFEYDKGKRFRGGYRISNWRDRAYTVVAKEVA